MSKELKDWVVDCMKNYFLYLSILVLVLLLGGCSNEQIRQFPRDFQNEIDTFRGETGYNGRLCFHVCVDNWTSKYCIACQEYKAFIWRNSSNRLENQ